MTHKRGPYKSTPSAQAGPAVEGKMMEEQPKPGWVKPSEYVTIRRMTLMAITDALNATEEFCGERADADDGRPNDEMCLLMTVRSALVMLKPLTDGRSHEPL